MEYRQINTYTMSMSELVDRLMEVTGNSLPIQNKELTDSLYVIDPDNTEVPLSAIPHELFYRFQVVAVLRYLHACGLIPAGLWYITN